MHVCSRCLRAANACVRANVPTTLHAARRRTLSKTAVAAATFVLVSREICVIFETSATRTEDCTATTRLMTVIAASVEVSTYSL